MSAPVLSSKVGRSVLRDIALYAPEGGDCAVDLSDNTNLWGMPTAAARALEGFSRERITRYPESYSATLKAALANYVGVSPGMIVTGCGSDDVLDSAIRAFAEPGDRVAHIDPTFSMVPIFARVNGAIPIAVPLTESYDVDVAAVVATDARVVYLCSPNNPTSGLLSRQAIETIVDQSRDDQVVIVDEAYAEFGGVSVVDLVRRCDRLLVTRTMSKAFGLAGLRIGYAIGSPALGTEVAKSRGPYKVNALAERVALAAVEAGVPWVRRHVAIAIDTRTRFERELVRRGLEPLPSAANFVLVPMGDAVAIARAMREAGVAVRPFDNLPVVSPALAGSNGSALRITIGPWPMMEAALEALDRARAICA